MILFKQSLIFGKLNISHHNFIHGNVFKPQGLFSSLSCVAVLKYVIICSMQPFYPSKFPQPDQSEASYSSLSTATKLHFCILEISTGSSSLLETSFSVVFTFISYLRGNFCTFFTLLYLPRYTYKKWYSIRLIKLIGYQGN